LSFKTIINKSFAKVKTWRWYRLPSPITAFVAAVVVFGLTLLLNQWSKLPLDLEAYAKTMNKELRQVERELDTVMRNKILLRNLLMHNTEEVNGAEWQDKPYYLYLYKNGDSDSLKYWTSTNIVPNPGNVQMSAQRSIGFYQLQNGKYELFKDSIRIDTTDYSLVGLIPISREYSFENEYLRSFIAFSGAYPKSIVLDAVPQDPKNSIVSADGQSHFWVMEDTKAIEPTYRGTVLMGYLLAILLLGFALNGFALYIAQEYSDWLGLMVLAVMIVLFRNWSNFWDLSAQFKDLVLFNPSRFTPSLLTSSLGDLLINVSLLSWLMLFLHRKVRTNILSRNSELTKLILVTIFYFCILSGVYVIDYYFSSVVLRSSISLDINDVFKLDVYSFWSLVAILALMGNLFLFSHKLSLFIAELDVPVQTRLGFLGVSAVLFTLLNFANAFVFKTLILLICGLFFIILLSFFVQQKTRTSGWMMLWLMAFSAFSAYQIYDYNVLKDLSTRRQIAQRVTQDRDEEAETRIPQLEAAIRADTALYKLYQDSYIPLSLIKQRIERNIIVDNYLSQKYIVDIHIYNALSDTIKGEKTNMEVFDSKFKEREANISAYSYFWNYHSVFFSYIVRMPVYQQKNKIGYLVLDLLPRGEHKSAVFDELLTSTVVKNATIDQNYDYAIYSDNELVRSKGIGYSRNLFFEHLPNIKQDSWQIDGNRNHLLYRAAEDKTVLVSKFRETLIKPFSLFSYIFFLMTIVMIFISLSTYVYNKIKYESIWEVFSPQIGLGTKIQYFIIGTIMVSFSLVAFISITYIRSNYADYLSERLLTKTKSVVDHDFQIETDSLKLPNIEELSDIHGADFNVYDLSGKLITSSALSFFDKGLSARQIPVEVMWQLREDKKLEITEEKDINGFKYKVLYMPLKNKTSKKLGYLGIPYTPGTDAALRRDIAGFAQTLLNVYVILLLAAGLVTLLIANSVTQPLFAIAERFQKVKLGAQNEPIKWDSNDEIGVLVSEYNKMILELEHSTELLAKSERDAAWREMAKQVAHEIKNPLTPMKLNLQMLDRAFQTNPEKAKELYMRVGSTLLQQIDNLSNIASQFSDFAKMPRANNETFMLNQVVGNVFSLFKVSENPNIEWNIAQAPEEFFVNTDKNQLTQVLNNIMKNAEQAMPDDRKQCEINVIIYKRDRYAVVQISDNGTGIPEYMLDKIFTPNFTSKSSGSGLGLAISKQIIESSGGSITFETEEGKGTDFFIELPLVTAFA
jgi:two-component system, NtrC family, nitrogen regulation sensor histidine kinase NtrY